ncbi:hypothetical protein [Actinomyces sp. MRS3W]|uniref:hypothetical protein n=1 Tax=Actinomyces sp. MRS3W TaxID=2800796 RepID=UPI0028FD8906|nr:hypothetical protein [Actinomyces sp. MRS3W]MDU0348631.1 hypothetical protein [Actinomyces sp. MRS3W]
MSSVQQIPPVFTVAGRHALSLVAREARADGIREVLVPHVVCPTMVIPFELEGMRVRTVACVPSGVLDPNALGDALADSDRPPLILHAETFGNHADAALTAALTRARSAGARVVVDATHTALERAEELLAGSDAAERFTAKAPRLDAGAPPADYVIASLRKLLPIPLGGVACGLKRRPELAWDDLDDDLLAVANAARRHPDAPALADGVEELLDLAWTPAPMPGPYRGRLAAPGLDAEIARRRERLARLHDAVAGLDVINPGAAYPPVIAHPRAAAIREALARAGLPVPLHWDGVTNELVALPNDPRAVGIVRRVAGRALH